MRNLKITLKHLGSFILTRDRNETKLMCFYLALGSAFLVLGKIFLVATPLVLEKLVALTTERNGLANITLILLIIAYGVSIFLKGFFENIADYLLASLTLNMETSYREGSINHLLKYHNFKWKQGELIEIWRRGALAIGEIINACICQIFPQFIAFIIIIFTLSYKYGIGVMVGAIGGGILYALWLKIIFKKIGAVLSDVNENEEVLSENVLDLVKNLVPVFLFKHGPLLEQKMQKSSSAECRTNQNLVFWQSIWSLGNIAVVALTMSLTLFLALGNQTTVESVGSIVALTYLVFMIFDPITQLSDGVRGFSEGVIKLKALLDITGSYEDSDDCNRQPLIDWKEIVLEHYAPVNSNGEIIIKPLSCSIKKGEKVCIVAESGIGKSTLAKSLVSTLLQEKSGKLYFLDADKVKTNVDSLFNYAAFLPQENYIYSQNLWLNITLGKEFSASSKSLITEVLNLKAPLSHEILKPSDDYSCHILSGGEKRRVSLGRVLIDERPIWILDEPFSGLDSNAKRTLKDNLKNIFTDKTMIMFTHEVDDAFNFDQVIRLEPAYFPITDQPKVNLF